MPRDIPLKFLPLRITLQARKAIAGSLGSKYDDPITDVEATVVPKRVLVRDQREGSETKGQEIVASTQVVMQLSRYVPPGSLVTLFPGTAMESTSEVVAAGYNDHDKAPRSAQLWLV